VLALVDDAHGALAKLLLQLVLAKLLRFDRGRAGLPLQSGDHQREDEDGDRAEHQQAEQRPEGSLENVERAEGLSLIDFSGNAEAVLGKPIPSAYDRHAAVVAITRHIDAGGALPSGNDHLGDGQLRATHRRVMPSG
jgi:hypothetical protein